MGQIDTGMGMISGGVDRVKRVVNEMKENPISTLAVLAVSGPAGLAYVSSAAEVKHIYGQLKQTYEQSGWTGINEQLNPVLHTIEAAYSTTKALEEGQYEEAGFQSHKTVLHAAESVAFAYGAAKTITTGAKVLRGRKVPTGASRDTIFEAESQPPGTTSKPKLGPAYETFEEASKQAEALEQLRGVSGKRPHVLGVIVRDAQGTIVKKWFEVSQEAGMLGHTEQAALTRMTFEPGSTIEFVGHYPPCALPNGCSQVMSQFAKDYNVDIRYRQVTADSTRNYEFRAGEGQVTKREVKLN